MIDDPYYTKLDRLDEQALKERTDMLERQAQAEREFDRQLGEQKLTFDEHFRQFEELREVHAKEHRETMDRLYAETLARERGPDGPDAPTGSANSNLEQVAAAERAAEQSRQDIAASQFAAQFAADQAAAAAEADRVRAEQAQAEKSRQDIYESKFAGQYGLDQAHEQQKQQEVAATIGGIDDPEMTAYLAQQESEIRQDWVERQRDHDEARRVEAAHDEHERNARSGDLQPVSYGRHIEADAKVFEDRREDARQEYAQMEQERIKLDLEGVQDKDVRAAYEKEIKEEYARKLAARLEQIAREEQARLERTRALYGREY